MKLEKRYQGRRAQTGDAFENLVAGYCDLPASAQLQCIVQGISKYQMEVAKKKFQLQYGELAEILHVTDRTLHHKKGEELFSIHVADKMYALIDLYSFGFKVFGAEGSFIEWMKTGNIMIGYVPKELLDSFLGIQVVKDELRRIAYGKL